MSRSIRAYVDLAGAMALVGASAALGRLALDGLPVFAGLVIRLGLAALVLCLLPVHGQTGPVSGPVRLSLRQWGVVVLQALCGVVVFNAGLLYGLERTGPVAAGIVTSATPVVMAGLGWALFRESMTGRKLAGIAVTMAGVLAVRGSEGGGLMPAGWSPGWGDVFLLAAVAGESVFLLARKWLPPAVAPLALARHVTLAGFVLVLGPGVYQLGGVHFAAVSLSAWVAVIVLGLAVTVGGYVLWFRGIARVPALHAAAITGILPVSSTLACWAIFGTSPALPQAAGCLAVAAGIWLVTGGPPRQQKPGEQR